MKERRHRTAIIASETCDVYPVGHARSAAGRGRRRESSATGRLVPRCSSIPGSTACSIRRRFVPSPGPRSLRAADDLGAPAGVVGNLSNRVGVHAVAGAPGATTTTPAGAAADRRKAAPGPASAGNGKGSATATGGRTMSSRRCSGAVDPQARTRARRSRESAVEARPPAMLLLVSLPSEITSSAFLRCVPACAVGIAVAMAS